MKTTKDSCHISLLRSNICVFATMRKDTCHSDCHSWGILWMKLTHITLFPLGSQAPCKHGPFELQIKCKVHLICVMVLICQHHTGLKGATYATGFQGANKSNSRCLTIPLALLTKCHPCQQIGLPPKTQTQLPQTDRMQQNQ